MTTASRALHRGARDGTHYLWLPRPLLGRARGSWEAHAAQRRHGGWDSSTQQRHLHLTLEEIGANTWLLWKDHHHPLQQQWVPAPCHPQSSSLSLGLTF